MDEDEDVFYDEEEGDEEEEDYIEPAHKAYNQSKKSQSRYFINDQANFYDDETTTNEQPFNYQMPVSSKKQNNFTLDRTDLVNVNTPVRAFRQNSNQANFSNDETTTDFRNLRGQSYSLQLPVLGKKNNNFNTDSTLQQSLNAQERLKNLKSVEDNIRRRLISLY